MAIQFEENQSRPASRSVPVGAVTRFFMKMGLAKTPKAATIPMIIIVVGALMATVYILNSSARGGIPANDPQTQAALDAQFELDLERSNRQ